jgi:hopanoid biosynthesis associated RND transporter like protein HpnN
MIAWLMRHLARIPVRFPRAIIALSLVLTVTAVVFVPRLHVSTDRNLLSGTDNDLFRRREQVNEMFGTTLVLVAIVAGPDLAAVREAVDELSEELLSHPRLIRDVFRRADLSFFEKHALLFSSERGLEGLVRILAEGGDGLERLAVAKDLADIIELGTGQLGDQPVPEDADAGETDRALEFFDGLLGDLAGWFTDPSRRDLGLMERLWSDGPSMAGGVEAEGYLVDNDGKAPRLAVVFVQPASDSQEMEVVSPLTDLVREAARGVMARRPGIEITVTGMPALATDELRMISRDCIVAGLAAGIGVLLVFILAFRSFRVGLFLVLPLGVGLLWSAGFTGALYGHLTMITSYFAAVLFGLGVAFTIHIVSRFHEALRRGASGAEAVETALTRAGPGVVVGGVTTALAFLAIAFSDFQGIAEMGVISGVGTMLILAANLTLLPAALLLWHPGLILVERVPARDRVFWGRLGRSRLVVPLLAAAALVAGVAVAPRLGFDYAVESMLPGDAEAVRGIRLLDRRTDFSTTYSVAVAGSLEEAGRLRERFAALPTVARAEAIDQFLPAVQDGKRAILAGVGNAVRERVAAVVAALRHALAGEAGPPVGRDRLVEAFRNLADTVQDLAFDAKKAGRREAPSLQRLASRVAGLVTVLERQGTDRRAAELEREVRENLLRGFEILAAGLVDPGFGEADLPETMRGRYLSRDGGKYAVIAFPRGDLGDRDFLWAHADELLSVDPGVTGHPVTHRAFTEMVHRGFEQAVALSAAAVVLLVLLDLRRPRGILLAFLPVAIGAGWTALVMYLTGFKWNYASLMALPILIGTAVDYGVHLAHRAEQEDSVAEAARTTGKAIALSGLTTLIGFGSLILGNHWGVRSLGLVLVIGISSALVATLVVLPGLLGSRGDREVKR